MGKDLFADGKGNRAPEVLYTFNLIIIGCDFRIFYQTLSTVIGLIVIGARLYTGGIVGRLDAAETQPAPTLKMGLGTKIGVAKTQVAADAVAYRITRDYK